MRIHQILLSLFLGSTLLLSLNSRGQVIKVKYKANAIKVENGNNKTQDVLTKIAIYSNEALANIDFFAVSNNKWNKVYYSKPMSNDSQIGDWSELAISIAMDSKQIFVDYNNQMAYYESSLIKKIRSVELPNVEWSISNISKEILGYRCYKASARIINASAEDKLTPPIEAWFTTELPHRGGPSAYATLPGMILEITSRKVKFKAIEITLNDKGNLDPSNYESSNILPHKEWTAYFERNNPRQSLRKQ